MGNVTNSIESNREYVVAHAAHYAERDIPRALQLYSTLMHSYPNAKESEYAHTQIQNIANAIVPKQELLDAQLELVLTHLEHDESIDFQELADSPNSGLGILESAEESALGFTTASKRPASEGNASKEEG